MSYIYLTKDSYLRYVTNSHKLFRKRLMIHSKKRGTQLTRHVIKKDNQVIVSIYEKVPHVITH